VIDTKRIKETHDLRRIVEQDLGQPPIRSGQAHLYKCPFHNERNGYSLAVWQDGYRCFGKCDVAGDLFDWLMRFRQLTFPEALSVLDSPLADGRPAPQDTCPFSSEPPPAEWQAAARQVVDMAEETLWSSQGEAALNYLLGRGLNASAIREARLGYVPGGPYDWRERAGLRVPCGILIPWFANGALWAVKVRRASGMPKYLQIAGGSSHGLYNADSLDNNSTALFCEGEFDALLVHEEAGDLVSAVTLGSAAARLTARWYCQLARHRTILVSYDRDPAGERGTQRLLCLSARFRSLPVPYGKDISDFHLNGGDIYSWIAAALDEKVPVTEAYPDGW
jgi:DNA primase